MSDRAADLRLQREYGITLEEYNRVLKYQGGQCAICNREPTNTRLSVDHCHDTGLLRGLLCWPCNRAIAHFQDSAEKLKAAAKYIQAPPLKKVLGMVFTAPGKVGTKRRAKLLQKRQSINRTEQNG